MSYCIYNVNNLRMVILIFYLKKIINMYDNKIMCL